MARKLFYTLICFLFFASTAFSASIIVNPKFLALVDGEPLSGGLVNTYECGGTTAKATYTTYTGGTANANPVVLSAQGEASIYASGCLKVVITTSAGAAVADGTIDNIYSFDQTILQDADRNTLIQVEESADEDIIRFDIDGTQKMYIDSDGVHIGATVSNETHGRFERPVFDWKDADEIYIGAGAYHHNGTSEQMVYWNSKLTFEADAVGSNSDSDDLVADTTYYLYLDDTAIVTQASALLDNDCFVMNDTAPTWSAAKHGWYSGNDRCIFAITTNAGSTAILDFWHDGGDLVLTAEENAYADTAPGNSASKDTVTLAIPGFSTKAYIRTMTTYVSGTDYAYTSIYDVAASRNGVGYVAEGGTTDQTNAIFFTDSTQKISVWTNAGDAKMQLDIFGWYFPSGM